MGPYGQIIQEIKARSLVFGLVKFAHESRKLNMDVGSFTKSSICESSASFTTGERAYVIPTLRLINK
jgi:hypothetical protein